MIPFSYKDGSQWTIVLMLGTGACGFIASFCQFFTTQRAHPAIFGIIIQTGVVYSILIDKYWFGLEVNKIQVIGIVILFTANILLLIKNIIHERAKAKEKDIV